MIVSKIGLSPLGEGLIISITSGLTAAIVVLVVSLAGLFLGVIYFAVIAQSTLDSGKRLEDADFLENIWMGWVRMIGLAVGVGVAMIVFGVVVSMDPKPMQV